MLLGQLGKLLGGRRPVSDVERGQVRLTAGIDDGLRHGRGFFQAVAAMDGHGEAFSRQS